MENVIADLWHKEPILHESSSLFCWRAILRFAESAVVCT